MPKILIVEDDQSLSRMYVNVMQHAGFEVGTAADGVEALEKIPEFKPELVMLDLNMPRKNGIEVFVTLKQDPRTAGIKILILTNAFTEASAMGAKGLGAEDLLVKSSVEPEELVEKVRGILQQKSAGVPSA